MPTPFASRVEPRHDSPFRIILSDRRRPSGAAAIDGGRAPRIERGLNASGRKVISGSRLLRNVAALALTVFFSVVMALLAALAFLWDQRNRGEDGYDRDALRPLDDDSDPPSPPSPLP
jgi:cbb3-type cytochrome oxidase maturation protein